MGATVALIADILLIAAALGAALYCFVLSRRLTKFSSLDGGVGGAISGLSNQVSEMTAALDRAQTDAQSSSEALEDATRRADAAARRIELLLASLHDLPAADEREPNDQAPVTGARNSSRPHASAAPAFRRRFTPTSRNEAAE
jgi:uncharacterized protein HemX